ncbi:kinase-like protein [Clavulina sp. PMI_390]|nr:kinase-like protein [Clavulina sp. PMI_390]
MEFMAQDSDKGSNISESDGSFSDDQSVPHISHRMATTFGIGDLNSVTSHIEISNLLDLINADIQRQSSNFPTYPETLRLLQDLCFYFIAIPRAFALQHITFDRKDVIGRGGQAIAYSGSLKGYSQRVVVREVVMAPWEWESPLGYKVTRLIHREAITHSLLHHPNVLPFLGIYHEGEGSPPLTIVPLIERGSLQKALEGPPISPHTLQSILLGVSSGVAYLHSQRPPIVHGDIHPGNILIDFDNNPYLCDFGLSRIRHQVTRTRTILQEAGRPRFMAPELFIKWTTSFRTSSASDIFSVAMTFLNVWSGRLPFSELRNDLKVMSSFRKGQRPEIPTDGVVLAPELRKHLWELLCEMWAQNPVKRPSSFEVLVRVTHGFDDQRNHPILDGMLSSVALVPREVQAI